MPHLLIASGPDAPSIGLRALDRWLDGVDDEIAERVRLAGGEALGNAVEHGAGARIRLEWTGRAPGGTLCIHDGGRFDPSESGTPRLPADLFATGGRGLFILATVADDITWSDERGLCLGFVWRETR